MNAPAPQNPPDPHICPLCELPGMKEAEQLYCPRCLASLSKDEHPVRNMRWRAEMNAIRGGETYEVS